MTPSPEPADITTLTLLQAIHDHQRTYDASTGWDRIKLLTPWRTLCTIYPEKVVDIAYTREVSCGHLEYGACACPIKCDLCLLNGTPARLTDKGLARLAELRT
ncbi:hypothetical protein [Streptomyces sp. NBC_00842]|uniref:hypothetical protein n=1 Tax=Streptomyces sp. NBC_00842 TaxID=2975848 RepID=UPI0038674200|nr:hypothetical protein OH821_45515 [Streptomyces sp. NBC_00842]